MCVKGRMRRAALGSPDEPRATKASRADRTYFAPGYYAANVADFDGNRLEFVHKAWNSAP